MLAYRPEKVVCRTAKLCKHVGKHQILDELDKIGMAFHSTVFQPSMGRWPTQWVETNKCCPQQVREKPQLE